MEIAPGIHVVIGRRSAARRSGASSSRTGIRRHWGNAPAIRKVTGAPIISTATEKQAIEERMTGARVDRVVEDAETPVEDVFRVIYSGLDERVGHLARNQIKSHLAKLEREGRVAVSGETYRLRPAS